MCQWISSCGIQKQTEPVVKPSWWKQSSCKCSNIIPKKKPPTEKQGKQLKIDLNELKRKGWGPKSSS
jgi:hypothetical protein